MDDQEISGLIMAVVGFLMILLNALSYLLGWTWKSPAFTILGLVLIVIGAKTAKKTSWI
jgi:membrane protein implicated in regulation of membrane protease activity